MSISTIGNDAFNGSSDDMFAQIRQSGGMSEAASGFAKAIIGIRDADGDGSLSLSETGLKEDAFGALDADSDGLVSSDELGADLKGKLDQLGSMMGQLSLLMQSVGDGNGKSSAETAASIVQHKDTDNDGLLTFEESDVSKEVFTKTDTDGDGYVSAEEIGVQLDKIAQRASEAGGESGQTAQKSDSASSSGASVQSSSGSSGGSGESEDDKDYDEYDLNKDGVVSADEYLQAFMNGDMSLADMFGDKAQSQGQSLTQRLAMEAYGAQATQA